jgi:dynein heavy chain
VLDIKTYRWLEPEASEDADGADADAAPTWPTLGETVWNHSAMAIQSVPSSYVFLFGGQNAPRRFGNSISVLDTGRNKWETPKTVTGAPPSAREDSQFAYDDSSKSLVLFGGWRQKWLDDVWTLNVAGICGPPYAVASIKPVSGPFTGAAPCVLTGLLFKDSQRISVKFATKDSKREMTVPGKYEDATHISCKSPNFEKHGALEVNVAVSIDGGPYTVRAQPARARTRRRARRARGPRGIRRTAAAHRASHTPGSPPACLA